jgi:hypothetical protein
MAISRMSCAVWRAAAAMVLGKLLEALGQLRFYLERVVRR